MKEDFPMKKNDEQGEIETPLDGAAEYYRDDDDEEYRDLEDKIAGVWMIELKHLAAFEAITVEDFNTFCNHGDSSPLGLHALILKTLRNHRTYFLDEGSVEEVVDLLCEEITGRTPMNPAELRRQLERMVALGRQIKRRGAFIAHWERYIRDEADTNRRHAAREEEESAFAEAHEKVVADLRAAGLELVDPDYEAPLKHWLVHDLIGDGDLACVFGRQGAGKSKFLVDLGGHVASGLSFHGRAVMRGFVLYVAIERADDVRRTLRAFQHHHRLGRLPFGFMLGPIDLRSAHIAADKISKAALDLAGVHGLPVRLIIIDTVNAAFGAGDENSSVDMGGIVQNVKSIQRATGAAVAWCIIRSATVPNGCAGTGAWRLPATRRSWSPKDGTSDPPSSTSATPHRLVSASRSNSKAFRST
jgi:hypothetical protein